VEKIVNVLGRADAFSVRFGVANLEVIANHSRAMSGTVVNNFCAGNTTGSQGLVARFRAFSFRSAP
jgi:hypothetical protein